MHEPIKPTNHKITDPHYEVPEDAKDVMEPIEAEGAAYKKRVKQMKGAAKDALDVARAGAGYAEADKELLQILANFLEGDEDFQHAQIDLLAWRDSAVVAELEELYALPNIQYQDPHVQAIYKSAIKDRLTKLKAIMEIKES